MKKLYSSRVVKQNAKFEIAQSKGEVSAMLFENSNLNLKTKEIEINRLKLYKLNYK